MIKLTKTKRRKREEKELIKSKLIWNYFKLASEFNLPLGLTRQSRVSTDGQRALRILPVLFKPVLYFI
jgi:hypothetical protein